MGELAESEQHHPDIHLTDSTKLSFVLTTHAIGALSLLDFVLAAKINEFKGFEGQVASKGITEMKNADCLQSWKTRGSTVTRKFIAKNFQAVLHYISQGISSVSSVFGHSISL